MAGTDPYELFFRELAEATESAGPQAPPSLKSRIYSAVVRAAQSDEPLCTLSESKAAGRKLCIFEEIVRIAPVGEAAQRVNWCRVCHARIIAERIDRAPIYWPGCPYVRFQDR